MRRTNIFNLPNPLAALGLGVHSTSNRNEYHRQKNKVSGKQSAAGGYG
jgi:hypothetical protein